MTREYLEQQAREIRKRSIDAIFAAGSGHPGASLSMAEIASVLFFDQMNLGTGEKDSSRDKFVLSKGHAAPALYAALSMKFPEILPQEELKTLRVAGARLQGHPVADGRLPYIEASTGSLGQGLSYACGLAIAKKMKIEEGNIYVIMGDGELQEGQNWEAFAFAGHPISNYKLDNLIVTIDRNKFQNDTLTEDAVSLEPLENRLESFGWGVQRIDGHSIEELASAYMIARKTKEKPSVIIADTIKGKGIRTFEENPGKSNIAKDDGAVDEEFYKECIRELGYEVN